MDEVLQGGSAMLAEKRSADTPSGAVDSCILSNKKSPLGPKSYC